ncbi:MAG: hypothetical protein LBK05_07335 [Treponema sp.]|jgi:hypothetical protein|nr:hypothetical protein [Treponema sp.]
MDAAVSGSNCREAAITRYPPTADRWSLPQANSDYKIRQDAGFWNAQGIEAVSFFAIGKKDTSVKPGPRAVLPYGQVGPRMRPDKKQLRFILFYPLAAPRASSGLFAADKSGPVEYNRREARPRYGNKENTENR